MTDNRSAFHDANDAYQKTLDAADLSAPPTRQLAVVTCMDARVDVYRLLGLELGQAHVIRNAGGVVTDDVIRSLSLSQHELGTREIAVIHHTACGLENLDEEDFLQSLEAASGHRPSWPVGAFNDVEADVRASIRTLRDSPFLADVDAITGYVYDVVSGELRPVAD